MPQEIHMLNIKALSLLVQKVLPRLSFFKVGQKSRSRSRSQNFWYQQKGLATSNTHVQYESPISLGSKVMTKVKFFSKVGQKSRSRSRCQNNFWYQQKGLATSYTHGSGVARRRKLGGTNFFSQKVKSKKKKKKKKKRSQQRKSAR